MKLKGDKKFSISKLLESFYSHSFERKTHLLLVSHAIGTVQFSEMVHSSTFFFPPTPSKLDQKEKEGEFLFLAPFPSLLVTYNKANTYDIVVLYS